MSSWNYLKIRMGIQNLRTKKTAAKKVAILVAVIVMAQKHMKRLVVFSDIYTN